MADRPAIVEDEHLEYLDELRESGATNMYGAASWLANAYTDLTKDEARTIHQYWMNSFGDIGR